MQDFDGLNGVGETMSTAEAAERLAEIVEAQSALIRKMVNALGQFEEFEKELRRINKLKEKLKN